MTADENYRRRLNQGDTAQIAAILAVADCVDELIALLRPLVAEPEPSGPHGVVTPNDPTERT